MKYDKNHQNPAKNVAKVTKKSGFFVIFHENA